MLLDYSLLLLLVLLLLALALRGHVAYWDRKLRVSVPYHSHERLVVGDGASIELRRVTRPTALGTLPPVMMVHGLGANHRNYDLDPDHSLARYLTARGRDVWLVTLRPAVRQRRLRSGKGMRFDALVRYDLPQALAAVLERTGATRVDYVGFSMGGMLLYAALGRTVTEQQLRRVAFIGSPAVIRFPWKLAVTRWFGHLPRGLFPPLPLGLWSRLGAFAVEVVRTPLHRLLFNPANVAPGVARRALANIIENIPGGLNWDFAVWLASSDGRLTFDGVAVLNSLAGVRTPALFVAGAVDRLAPIEAVRVAYQSWGSEAGSIDKQLLVLGKNSGTKEDYGHGDLAVGRYAQTELFAAVAEFLAKPEPKPG